MSEARALLHKVKKKKDYNQPPHWAFICLDNPAFWVKMIVSNE